MHGEWVVNAMHGEDALQTLPKLPLSGKLLLDIGNFRSAVDGPLIKTLGESLQSALPDTRVVKALNSVSAQLMGESHLLGAVHTVFIAGNDADDRSAVAELLTTFGWQDIIDLGDLTACRPMEQLGAMWVRLYEKLGHVYFNLAVVRKP
jgi:predicted dinucleotide-binding enzyme